MKKACKSGKRIQKFAQGGIGKLRHGQGAEANPKDPAGLKKTVYY